MSNIHIIQHGVDGMGHQLHGLLSCLALHNVKSYYFDGHMFINKPFRFDHIKGEEAISVKNYLIEIGKSFIKHYNQSAKRYKKHIHSHEVYNIPKDYDTDTIYSLDNCYYFDRIPIDNSENAEYRMNIQVVKQFFKNYKLPPNRLDTKNIVIHLRQGDAMTTGRGSVINKHNQHLMKIMPKLAEKYSDYTFYIHTDGNATFLLDILYAKKVKCIIFGKDEHILNVLSDFIHSDVFITGHSGLSTVCTFLGRHTLTIIPDDIKHSIPDSAIRITDYEHLLFA